MKTKLFLLTLVAASLTACAGMPVAISPSSSPLPPFVRGSIPAWGDDCTYALLGLFPITPPMNTQKALSEAKEDAEVDVITDVTVDFTGRYWILFSNQCVHVRGLGVPRSVLAEAEAKVKSFGK